MRKLADNEVLSLTNLLDMEKDGLIVTRAMQPLVTDETLRQQIDASILASQGRIRGIQQFINENNILDSKEVR